MSKVSVIVPVYNSGKYLDECINSILTQSYNNIELVLVNDGSTDNSEDICGKYLSRRNVKLITQHNQGVSVARQNGVDAATGEWVLFVDSDDTIPENAIKTMVDISDSVDIVAGATNYDRRHKLLPDYIKPNVYIELLYSENFGPSPVCKLFRRKLFLDSTIRQFKVFPSGEDLLMNLCLAVLNKKDVRVCKEQVYDYRLNESSVTHSFRCSFDYCERYFNTKDLIIKDLIPIKRRKELGISQRIRFYYQTLITSNFNINKENLFVQGLLQDIRDFQSNNFFDRIALQCDNRVLLKIFYYLYRIRVRLEGRLHF